MQKPTPAVAAWAFLSVAAIFLTVSIVPPPSIASGITQSSVQADGTTICISSGVISQCTASGSLTQTQIVSLSTSPVTLIPAQGAGTSTQIDNAMFEMVAGGTQYASSATFQLHAGVTFIAGACVAAFLTSASNETCITPPSGITNGLATTLVNQPITFAASANPTCASTCGTINYWVKYRVLNGF